MAHQPPHPRRSRAGAALAVLFAFTASGAMSACSAGSHPASQPAAIVDKTEAVDAAPVTTASKNAKASSSTSLAPTGDATIDQLGTDMAAFEQESAGLDNGIAAANPEVTK